METERDIEGESMIQKTISLAAIDPKRARFPCCIVWTPLPFISWLIPFIGHVGICREDGVILDFAGPHFVSVDNFSFGAVARYIQLNRSDVDSSLSFSILHSLIPPKTLIYHGSLYRSHSWRGAALLGMTH